MSTLGARLREERQRLGMNQEAFAGLGGVARRAQVHYESDERTPDAGYLAAIAAAGADVMYVLTGARSGGPVAQPETRREMALLDHFRHAPADAQDGVLKILAASAQPHSRRKTG